MADDLEQYPQWRSNLHELGDCEVKHGARLHIVNLYTEELGNPKLPEKFERTQQASASAQTRSNRRTKPLIIRIGIFLLIFLAFISLVILAVIFAPAMLRSRRLALSTSSASPAAVDGSREKHRGASVRKSKSRP